MNLIDLNFFLSLKTIIAQNISTIFLRNVSQLLITSASPKHPQSDTGFLSAINKVSGVKILIKIKAPIYAHFMRILKTIQNPIMNSIIDNSIENVNDNELSQFIEKALK